MNQEIRRRSKVGLSKNIIMKINLTLEDDEEIDASCSSNGVTLPGKAEKKGYCFQCIDNIKGDGYNAKKAKLSQTKNLCQLCGDRCCSTHMKTVCDKHKDLFS